MVETRLGNLIARYRCRPLHLFDFLFISLLGGLAVLLPLAIGFQRYYTAQINYGPVASIYWSRPWFVLACMAVLPYSMLVIYCIWRSNRTVVLYQQGLRINLLRSTSLRWEQVDGIIVSIVARTFLRKPITTDYRVWLLPATGARISLPPDLEHLPELTSQIKAHIYPRLSRELSGMYKQGKRLYFGPLTLHRDGIGLIPQNGRAISVSVQTWDEIAQLRIKDGTLILEYRSGAGQQIPVGTIPNIEILMEIIQTHSPA